MIGSVHNLLILIDGRFPIIQWQTCDAYSGREQVQYCKHNYITNVYIFVSCVSLVEQVFPNLPVHISSLVMLRGIRAAQFFFSVYCFVDHCIFHLHR
jgi:hypothetical protein